MPVQPAERGQGGHPQPDHGGSWHTRTECKVAHAAPHQVHFRGGRAAIDIKSYPDMDKFFADLAQVYKKEIQALADAGVRGR